jgi:hypothetical protein
VKLPTGAELGNTKQNMDHSRLLPELNKSPLLGKRMNGASLFSPPEVVRIIQKRERASALFIFPATARATTWELHQKSEKLFQIVVEKPQ